MNTFKRGDVAFVMHHNSRMSRVIAWFMGSRWSHSLGILGEGAPGKKTYVCETSDFEVVISDLEKYLNDPTVSIEIWSPQVDDEYREKAAEKWVEFLGEIYGYPQLLSLGLRRMLMRVHVNVRNLIRTNHVCDQLVLEGIRCYPIPGIHWCDPKAFDTQDLYEMIVKSGKFDLVFSKRGQ